MVLFYNFVFHIKQSIKDHKTTKRHEIIKKKVNELWVKTLISIACIGIKSNLLGIFSRPHWSFFVAILQ